MKIILGSQSKNRLALLRHIPIPITVIKSSVDEDKINGKNPKETLQKRANAKANDIMKIITNYKNLSNITYLVITADSGVIIENRLLGKPKSLEEARKMLKKLSGKTHDFATATSIIKLKTSKKTGSRIIKEWDNISQTKITFRKLSRFEIYAYIKMLGERVYTIAGAYTITDSPQSFISKVEGSITNVIGLPLETLLPILFAEKIL